MNPNAIIYPAIAMFALSIGVIIKLGTTRFVAIRRREVSIRFFRTYDEGTQPKRLHLLSRHVQNHFEIPPLFYVGVILTYIAGFVTLAGVTFAWLYVASRSLHTYIHLGSNNVTHRFFVFAASLLFLFGLWLTLLVSLVKSAA